MKISRWRPERALSCAALAAALAATTALAAQKGQAARPELAAVELSPFVVTAPRPENPLEVVLDAKAAYQPMPAQDGADFLKSVPGFSVTRKGGTDGDPSLRGMAGSRLGISVDGQDVLGGCSHRMDPPTAYVFPSSYDRVTVLKGPQSVLYGPGISAGVVRFESDLKRLQARDIQLESTLTAGAFDRVDAVIDATVGDPSGYARVALTRTSSGNYRDGSGGTVHSEHLRWSANASIGWTPNDASALQYTLIRSDGEAAYADRMMDGAFFRRESHQLRFLRDGGEGLVKRSEVEAGYTFIDHGMDNFSMRTFVPSSMMPHRTVSNPARKTLGGRARFELAPNDDTALWVGADGQANAHSVRSSMNETERSFQSMPRVRDAEFLQYGVFGELSQALGERHRLVAGARLDRWRVEDLREEVAIGMMNRVPNPTAGQARERQLTSGFLRLEGEGREASATYYAGIGYVERFLDYWELIANESATGLSGLDGPPERTLQLDVGGTRRVGDLELSLAFFASEIDDYALVESGFSKPAGAMGQRRAVVTRPVEAWLWGGEAAVSWRWREHWLLDASLAYAQGENRADDLPLAQVAPLESRLSLSYFKRNWSVGGLLRWVDRQDRFAIGQGNIVGQDIGPTAGFATLAFNGSWHLREGWRLSAGVDNALDRTYAEHISRAGAAIPGYAQTTRVNEPGRAFWTRLDLSF